MHDHEIRRSFMGRVWRSLIPLVLIFMGVWGLSGCFYLPVLDQRADKKQPDFREMVGDAKSSRPIRPGAITRQMVIAKLGHPSNVSDDWRTLIYELNTVRGVWVWPLCFHAAPADKRVYILHLTFDQNDILVHWKMRHEDTHFNWLILSGPDR